ILFIQHADMNDDLARFGARLALKTDTKPAVRFVVLFETAGSYRVSKHEEGAFVSDLIAEAFKQEAVLVIDHFLETLATDIAIGRSVYRIAESHVVSGHRLGNGPGCAADMKKTTRHLLPGSDF